jgi:hypothetical protein
LAFSLIRIMRIIFATYSKASNCNVLILLGIVCVMGAL